MQNRYARGRELLFIIFQHYSTGKTIDMLYSINDLQAIRSKADQLENFENTWVSVLNSLAVVPDTQLLEHLYYQQVKGMKLIAEDINHYNRKDFGHPDRSYKFLYESVELQLKIARQEKVRADLGRGVAGDTTNQFKLPAAAGTPNPKRLPKGKRQG